MEERVRENQDQKTQNDQVKRSEFTRSSISWCRSKRNWKTVMKIEALFLGICRKNKLQMVQASDIGGRKTVF
jgi:hypothetical protein